MRPLLPRPVRPRRGVTLVEMLVVVALVILMMVILVQIFQVATGAMSASRANQELDNELRQLDLRIKQDLGGATARFTPPLDPSLKLGYFEYGENAFADAQGEDTDDYIAFTTKAPEGQVFTGRVTIPIASAPNQAVQPVTITSQLAEVIYFLRNGNLYRRVFLIVPERQGSLFAATTASYAYAFQALSPTAGASWIGVNDLSARPSPTGLDTLGPILNDLGSLTNRENRAFKPRFRSDFFTWGTGLNGTAVGTIALGPDGIDDDLNGDDVPDFVPTLYPDLFANNPNVLAANGLINENAANLGTINGVSYPGYPTNDNPRGSNFVSLDAYAFPYIYPGMYSQPDTTNGNSLLTGWVHSLDPSGTSGKQVIAPPVATLPLLTGNHSPLFTADSLTTPSTTAAGQQQTWWGFPTWRESLTARLPADPNGVVTWQDPVFGINYRATPPVQQVGLQQFSPKSLPPANSLNFLPPIPGQYATDFAGSPSFSKYSGINWQGLPNLANVQAYPSPIPGVWDDDLIMTNVRSFDVKAYDHDAPLYINAATTPPFLPGAGYYDLGYGLPGNLSTNKAGAGLGLDISTPISLWGSNNQPQGFGHAGRMPPLGSSQFSANLLVDDHRVNPSRPINPFLPYNPQFPPANLNYVGDNGGGFGITRLTRVWDSWSTDYSNVTPDYDINLRGYPGTGLPIYPSYPPPYPTPLRGIQIQIRVADPRNEHVKVLTIRQDFSDKL